MPCPDNYDAFCWHEAKQEEAEAQWLAKLPECSECGEKITSDDCYELDGELHCEDCMAGHRKCTENYYRED